MGEMITDKAVLKATGKTWSQWFEELEASPISEESGTEAQAWLTENHTEIGGWWCQVITRRWDAQRRAVVGEPS